MYRTYLTTIKNSLSVGLCVAQIDCHLPHIHIVFPVDQGLMMKTNCGMVSMMFVSSFVQKILLLKSPWPVPLVSMLLKKTASSFGEHPTSSDTIDCSLLRNLKKWTICMYTFFVHRFLGVHWSSFWRFLYCNNLIRHTSLNKIREFQTLKTTWRT